MVHLNMLLEQRYLDPEQSSWLCLCLFFLSFYREGPQAECKHCYCSLYQVYICNYIKLTEGVKQVTTHGDVAAVALGQIEYYHLVMIVLTNKTDSLTRIFIINSAATLPRSLHFFFNSGNAPVVFSSEVLKLFSS